MFRHITEMAVAWYWSFLAMMPLPNPDRREYDRHVAAEEEERPTMEVEEKMDAKENQEERDTGEREEPDCCSRVFVPSTAATLEVTG